MSSNVVNCSVEPFSGSLVEIGNTATQFLASLIHKLPSDVIFERTQGLALGPIFFYFHAVLGEKIGQIIGWHPLLCVCAPWFWKSRSLNLSILRDKQWIICNCMLIDLFKAKCRTFVLLSNCIYAGLYLIVSALALWGKNMVLYCLKCKLHACKF